MMTRQQYLLIKLAEEASEIAQIALKTAQFGLGEKKPGQDETNIQRVQAEFNDLFAMVEMLNDEFSCGIAIDHEAIEAKKLRINTFYGYSESLKMVESRNV